MAEETYFMTFFQTIFMCFALVGIWHTFVLILCSTQSKEEWKIGVKYELAGILVLFLTFSLYALFGEL